LREISRTLASYADDTTTFFGDAKQSVTEVAEELKAL
jgi:NAD/NADP transhydrogenase beta subunit